MTRKNINPYGILPEKLLTEALCPMAELTLDVKRFLDKTVRRQPIADIDNNGYPTKTYGIEMVDENGNHLQTMSPYDLLLFVDDHFQYVMRDTKERREMFKKIITHWYFNRISPDGILIANGV